MSTIANNEDPDKKQHNAAFHQVQQFKIIKNLQTRKLQYFRKIVTRHPKICTMDYPKFVILNQKEESITIPRENKAWYNYK